MPNDKLLLQRSLKHWDRMIKYAAASKPEAYAAPWVMLDGSGESWFANHCPLCRTYNPGAQSKSCGACPLNTPRLKCGQPSNVDPWSQVELASTWDEWLVAARDMRGVLAKKLADIVEKEEEQSNAEASKD